MREIRFRGKGIEENDKDKWYYGYYVKLDKTTYCFKEDYERNKDNSEHKILFDVMTDWGLPNQHKMADININTLGQFTGLYDKNNVAIYEGDKMKNSKGGKGIVKYSEYGEFVLEFEDENTMSSFNPAILRNYEVYGNIHEGGSEI